MKIIRIIMVIFFFSDCIMSAPLVSRIDSVKLFQNRGEIERIADVQLKKGLNRIEIGSLPVNILDWSVKASAGSDVRILSVEIEKFALSTRRRLEIEKLEKQLDLLNNRDREHLDTLLNINSQLKFLDGISSVSAENAKHETVRGVPNSKAWASTLDFIAARRKSLYLQKRSVEQKRIELGKEIRKWEYELSKIGGSNYYGLYQRLNKSAYDNASGEQIQKFADMTDVYEKRNIYLVTPVSENDYEKRAVIEINSPGNIKTRLRIKYLIPGTAWKMEYDIRAQSVSGKVEMALYANLFQQTGENWENVKMSISTGSPAGAISVPVFYPWFLDIERKREESSGAVEEYEVKRAIPMSERAAKDEVVEAVPEIKKTGTYMTIELPARQTIKSLDAYQKKLIRNYTISSGRESMFYYESFPARSEQTYIKTKIANSTELPWLSGPAQIFLDNEFMGRASVPYTPQGEDQEIVLGTYPEISSNKKLVKRYEKKGGVFGSSRVIEYNYMITVHNRTSTSKNMVIMDNIPVSRNKDISVKIEDLSDEYSACENKNEETLFEQGLRKWKFVLGARAKKEISYKIIVSFDKDSEVSGL